MLTRDDAKKALLKLFHCFQWTANETERKIKFAAYWEMLEKTSPRFVVEACEYAARGKLGDAKFLPTAGELYQCAQAFAARDVAARGPRRALSEPETRNDPQTRARIIAGFARLLADLRRGNPIDPADATKAVFNPVYDHARPHPISESLRRATKENVAN